MIDLKTNAEQPVMLAGEAWHIEYQIERFTGERAKDASIVDYTARIITINSATPVVFLPLVTARAIETVLAHAERGN